MPNPTGGTKINRANTVAMVVFKPNFALPLPGPETVREREKIQTFEKNIWQGTKIALKNKNK